MNPGLGGPLATARIHEWRAEAKTGAPTARRMRGPHVVTAAGRRAVTAAGKRAVPRRRLVLRPVGRVLIRVGRRLAGPEPERQVVALRRPGWSR
jgi:hypothetical protein